jgi:hypothetical protein
MQKEIEAIAESLELSGALEQATEQRDRELSADPEWATEKYVHVHVLLEAFAVGVISADPWHHGYKLPPGFESVVNWIAFNIQKQWPKEEVVQISLNQIKILFRTWANEHPVFLEWNEPKPGAPIVACVSRYTNTPDERDFIDLDALIHNAVLHIRAHHRACEAFDRKFAEANPGWESLPND